METWHSPRYYEEERRRQMSKIFDDFVDMALEGTITLEQAILGCKEVVATAEELDGTVR